MFKCDDGNISDFSSHVDVTDECCDVSFTILKIMQVLKSSKPKKLSEPDSFPNIRGSFDK